MEPTYQMWQPVHEIGIFDTDSWDMQQAHYKS
jgi:hypothetical protein